MQVKHRAIGLITIDLNNSHAQAAVLCIITGNAVFVAQAGIGDHYVAGCPEMISIANDRGVKLFADSGAAPFPNLGYGHVFVVDRVLDGPAMVGICRRTDFVSKGAGFVIAIVEQQQRALRRDLWRVLVVGPFEVAAERRQQEILEPRPVGMRAEDPYQLTGSSGDFDHGLLVSQ